MATRSATREAVRARDFLSRLPPSLNSDAVIKHVDTSIPRLLGSIDDILDVIRTLKAARNAAVPVGRLPSEMLTEIFCHLKGWMTDLVTATHVCRYWREAALQSAQLWTDIQVTDSDRVDAFLSRSGSLPLDVSIPAALRQVNGIHRVVTLIAPNMLRLRTLSINTPEPDGLAYLLHRLTKEAPRLRDLHIAVPDREWINFTAASRDYIDTFGSFLAGGKAPLLRSFSTSAVVLPWAVTRSLCRDLTRLEIKNPFPIAPSSARIVQLLRQCPSLEALTLSAHPSHRGVPDEDILHGAPAPLPRLSTLVMNSILPEQSAAILEHVTLPATTQITLSLTATPDEAHHAPWAMLPPPPSRTNLPGLASPRMLAFLELTEEQIVLNTYVSAHPGPRDTPALTLALGVADSLAYAERLPALLPLARLETLVLSNVYAEFDGGAECWAPALAALSALRTLRLVRLQPESLADLLTMLGSAQLPDAAAAARGAAPRWFCESLRHLAIVQLALDEPEDEALGKPLYKALCHYADLRARVSRGTPSVELLEATGGADLYHLEKRLRRMGFTVSVN